MVAAVEAEPVDPSHIARLNTAGTGGTPSSVMADLKAAGAKWAHGAPALSAAQVDLVVSILRSSGAGVENQMARAR